ncbi:MAG TPA: hypothetical protein VGE39_19630 [Prosthecobacter sp.]
MGSRAIESGLFTSASSKLSEEMRAWVASFDEVVATHLPEELQDSARELVRSVALKVAVAEHFDAFCGQAFSKPEWAAAASPVIAEIFERDEDLLAELARIPDLIIEMSSGEVTMTCIVASRWAARGETHRLSRLADSLVASHASKNASSAEVMLALAATLGITRHSRAEQLYNAALPLAGSENAEALADARLWLAAGRVVCSIPQEERDFWETRLRKPKQPWTWESKQERHALETLSEKLVINEEAEGLFKAVVPECWWDLAQRCARQQEKLAEAAQLLKDAHAQAKGGMPSGAAAFVETTSAPDEAARPVHENGMREFLPRPRPGPLARFVLGWVCGAMAMAITVVVLPSEFVQRVFGIIKTPDAPSAAHTPGQKEAWRKENLRRITEEMANHSKVHEAAKNGSWSENEKLISGDTAELPAGSPDHLKLLVWLHLDPPQDAETRTQVAAQLIRQAGVGTISLWEELLYPGSPNAEEIQNAARTALADPALHWKDEERKRLQAIVDLEFQEAEGKAKSAEE